MLRRCFLQRVAVFLAGGSCAVRRPYHATPQAQTKTDSKEEKTTGKETETDSQEEEKVEEIITVDTKEEPELQEPVITLPGPPEDLRRPSKPTVDFLPPPPPPKPQL